MKDMPSHAHACRETNKGLIEVLLMLQRGLSWAEPHMLNPWGTRWTDGSDRLIAHAEMKGCGMYESFVVGCPASLHPSGSYVRVAHTGEAHFTYADAPFASSAPRVWGFAGIHFSPRNYHSHPYPHPYVKAGITETCLCISDTSPRLRAGRTENRGSGYEFVCWNHCSIMRQITRLMEEDDILLTLNAFAQTANWFVSSCMCRSEQQGGGVRPCDQWLLSVPGATWSIGNS